VPFNGRTKKWNGDLSFSDELDRDRCYVEEYRDVWLVAQAYIK